MSRGRPPDDLFDWAVIGGVVVLIGHSIRRHRAVFFGTWLSVVALSVGLMVGMPRTYEVEASLQFQRAQALSSLGTGQSTSKEADAPTKAAAQMVLKHENLVALVNQTDMVHVWFKHRAPLMQLKDAVYAKLFVQPSEEDLVEGFVGLLEDRLWVSTSEGTVSLGIRLADPQLAFLLVDGALENFLEARHAAEVSAIGEEIGILQNRADEAQEAVEKSVEELQTIRMERAKKLGRRPRRIETLVPVTPDERTSQLEGEAESKRRALADLEEFRRRRITQLETTLEEQKALYSDSHPAVQDVRQALEAVRHESPQILALRRDVAALEVEIKRRGLGDGAARARRGRDATLQNAALETEDSQEMEDPDVEYAKALLRYRIKQYNGLLERVQAARLSEDTARAAFKYRYSIIRPPQRPTGPVAPQPGLVISSSVVAGLLLALLATAFRDFSSRKFLEPWQVEYSLGLPLLGVIRLPSAP